MRIFGSVDTFVESSGTLRLGRLVANATFLESLLRHGPYDLYEFFCPTQAERARLEEFLRTLPDGARLLARCRLRLQLELPKALVEPAWEVMHFGGWGRYLPSLAWARARWSSRPFPLTGTIHSLDDPSMPRALGRLVRSPLGNFDAIVCTSRAGREAFSRQVRHVAASEGCDFPARLETVPLGVGESAFQPPAKDLARSRLGIPAQARVATWLGRISATSKADLHPLLYQWRLMEDVPNGRLLVLAGGATEGDVRSLHQTVEELGLSNSVRFVPDLDDRAKADLLGASDVFVSPVDNFQETFGISVVEAMAAGLPVVASDWDGYKDLVEDGVTGILVPTRWAAPPRDLTDLRQILEPGMSQLALGQGVVCDPAKLRSALQGLLDNPERARRMGAQGQRRARERFSWRTVVESLASVWGELSRTCVGSAVPGGGTCDPEIFLAQEMFGHFGTCQPGVWQGQVALAELGRRVLDGRIPMPPTFTDLLDAVDGRLLTELVVSLRPGPREVGDHLRQVCARTGRSVEEATWVLAWLLKYGILELG